MVYFFSSGVGKTTLAKKFNKNINHLKSQYLIQQDLLGSNEVDGVDYHFVHIKKFEN